MCRYSLSIFVFMEVSIIVFDFLNVNVFGFILPELLQSSKHNFSGKVIIFISISWDYFKLFFFKIDDLKGILLFYEGRGQHKRYQIFADYDLNRRQFSMKSSWFCLKQIIQDYHINSGDNFKSVSNNLFTFYKTLKLCKKFLMKYSFH